LAASTGAVGTGAERDIRRGRQAVGAGRVDTGGPTAVGVARATDVANSVLAVSHEGGSGRPGNAIVGRRCRNLEERVNIADE
jgi:hypothetical protein